MLKKIMIRNIFGSIQRHFISYFGIVISTMILIVGLNYQNGLEAQVQKEATIDENQIILEYDESIVGNNSIDYYANLTEKYPHVSPYMFSSNTVSINVNDNEDIILNYLVTDTSNEIIYLRDGNNFLIPDINYEDNEIETNNIIILPMSTKDFIYNNELLVEGINFKIAGYYDDTGEESKKIIFDYRGYSENIDPNRIINMGESVKYNFDSYLVTTEDLSDSDISFIKSLYNDYNPNSRYIYTLDDIITQSMSEVFPYSDFFIIFYSAVILLSFLNIINSLTFNMNERRKNDVIYLILGMSVKTLKKYYIFEYMIVGIFMGVLSICLGNLMSYIILHYIPSIDYVGISLWTNLSIIICISLASVIYSFIVLQFTSFKKITNNVYI